MTAHAGLFVLVRTLQLDLIEACHHLSSLTGSEKMRDGA